MTTNFYCYRRVAAVLVLCAALDATAAWARQSGAGQPSASSSADTPRSLPSAPSAVLAQQEEQLGRAAGSGYLWVAPSTRTGPGGLPVEQASSTPLPLSLDDAISLGLERNIRLRYDRANQRAVKGYNLGVFNALLPNLTVQAQSSAQEVNLAAMGFKASSLAAFGIAPGSFATIAKVNTTQASLNVSQTLFNAPDIAIYRGTSHEAAYVDLTLLSDRGDLVLTVGQQYLLVLADQASLTNALAQQSSAEALFQQTSDRQKAGVGIHLDTLRAQVQYQQRQQDVLAARNAVARDTMHLARTLGLPADQPLQLTDTVPYEGLVGMDLDVARDTAYIHRKDLLSLQEQLQVADAELKAVRYQRLPVLAFNGYYGVIGITNGSYHGNFVAEGTLKFPIFKEAEQRGQQEVVSAQLTALRQQEASLRVTIDAQIRSAMLDAQAAQQLVTVAQSNVKLAAQELSDEQARFTAGVDDSLPVVDAETSLAQAQSQLVRVLYQYNVAKLQLARATGVVETRYRTYLNQ